MPVAKRSRRHATVNYLIFFVGLSIVMLIIAILLYRKIEQYRSEAETAKTQLREMTTAAEWQNRGSIVGAKQSGKSRLGTMVDYLDEMVYLIIGGVPEKKSAEVKVGQANRKAKEMLELLAQRRPDSKNIAPKVPTNEFVELLVKEQFSTATENFDETMKNAFPTENLEEVWKSTISQMGPFKQQIGIRKEKQLEYDIVFVTCEFEKGPLDVKLVYNSENQVAGLFIVPTPPDVLESYQGTSEPLAQEYIDIEIVDPNTTGLVQTIKILNTKLVNTTNTVLATQQQLNKLKNRFDDAMAATFEKEQTLIEEKEKYQQQVNDIKQDYDDLEALMQQTTDKQVQTLRTQLKQVKADRNRLNQELLKTQAELQIARGRMKRAQDDLAKIVGKPDSEVTAFQPDGEIMLIDNSAKVVHLDIGIADRVYQGLTFAVYEKNTPIPRDGKGKAEIQVFDVDETFSAARIIRSEIKRPIVVGDTIANLIWDSDQTNVFVVVGDFDFENDGTIDYDAIDRIEALIKKWGGSMADTISVETDFLVIGTTPKVLSRPTFEQMEVDPMAMEKYEASLQKLADYRQTLTQAQTLSIPVFNYERFLYFIGYKTQATRPGAFSK